MTTICYRGGILAGDTRCTTEDDGILPGHVRKVHKLRSGSLIGFAGTLAMIQKVVAEVKKNPHGDIIIKPGEEIEGLLIYADGEVAQLDSAGWTKVRADYYSIGSGAIAARVAMRLGKSAAEAVKIAMEFDPGTGGRVQTVRLGKRR